MDQHTCKSQADQTDQTNPSDCNHCMQLGGNAFEAYAEYMCQVEEEGHRCKRPENSADECSFLVYQD